MKNRPFPYYEVPFYETLEQLLVFTKSQYSDRVLFRSRRHKGEETVTYNGFYEDVWKLSAYFAGTYGTRNRIAVLGENSYAWILTYFAVICSNNVIVPIDKELSATDDAALLKECSCSVLVYSDDYGDIADELVGFLTDLDGIAMSELHEHMEAAVPTGWSVTDPNAPAAILYTSGTTGKGKGVVLSQSNLCADARHSMEAVQLYGKTIALLPFHHAFAFTVSVLCGIYSGIDTLIAPSLKNVVGLMNDFKPTYLTVVPLIVEKMDREILAQIEKSGKKKLLGLLHRVCLLFDAFGIDLRSRCFSSIRNGLGGALDFIISGGAPLDQHVIDRFDSYGIKILNGYGISECSPVVSVNRRYHFCSDSVGQPLPGVDVKIDLPDETGEGEICVRGDIVMIGYYNMPEETQRTVTDGWFHTGDIGKLDKDGFIHITGRMKNLIILSNGKNVSPEELETRIGRIPGVAECLVSTEDNTLVAEIYPDEVLRTAQQDLQVYFNEQIDRLNDTLPPYKAIAKVMLRETEFCKTSSKKIKRNGRQ